MMSQHSQHSHTNGASLEDCHTNFFALTDLCGIKWHVFSWECNSASDPLEDPVLKSYSRCLAANVLCVWRRTWLHSQVLEGASDVPPHVAIAANHKRHSLRFSPKELWVFWYGDEPDLSSLLSPELTKSEGIQGSWDWETGLTYEFRTILFKALHNLIERCLLTREFIRLGKWFVQPYDGPETVPNNNSTNLSFSLSFFIHGESTVCASVDVRQHPPARRLNKSHFTTAQQTSQGIPVILGPYGMKGNLSGVTYRSSEPHTQKILEDWKQYFPLESQSSFSSSRDSSSEVGIPPVVEVIVGGYKLRYPSSYVLVTDLDSPQEKDASGTTPNSKEETSKTAEEITEASAYAGDRISPFTASTHTLLTPDYQEKSSTASGYAREMSEQIWQDAIQLPGSQSQAQNEGLNPAGTLTPAELAGQWEFDDPAAKVGCSCTKCKSDTDATNNTKSGRSCEARVTNHASASGGWPSAKGQPVAPFHWRPPPSPVCVANSLSGQSDSDMLQATARTSNTSGLNPMPNSFNDYKSGSIATPGSVPSLRMLGLADPPPSVDSPASVTPSPLPTPRTPHSHNIANHAEPNIPTMSPCPPSNTSVLDPNTPHQFDSVDNKQNVLDMLGPKSTSSLSQGMSPYPGSIEGTPCKTVPDINVETVVSEFQQSAKDSTGSASLPYSLRKPVLHSTDYRSLAEQETKRQRKISSRIDDWSCYPTKKFRPEEHNAEQELWPPYRPKHIAQMFEAKTNWNKSEQDFPLHRKVVGMKRNLEPYNFEDGGPLFDLMKVKDEKDDSKGDPHSPSKKLGNLYTIEGLVPKASDLDTIFDSPIEDYPGHTPPGSNTPIGNSDDATALMHSKLAGNTNLQQKNPSNATFELTQLTKMYPTPPSLEHNPEHDAVMEDGALHISNIKQEPEESLQNHDLSFTVKDDPDSTECPMVYRPSTVAPFVISDMYKPLVDLPSKLDKEVATLPHGGVYNPSWQTYQTPERNHYVLQNGHAHLPSVPSSHVPLGPSSGTRIGLSPISPMIDATHRGPSSVGPASTGALPANYELPSPASNHSSYLNKTLPSVEPPAPSFFHVPESNALLANIVLQDSSINLFKDHNFDSCTMCVCNNNNEKVVGNIRGSDGSMYLPPSQLSAEEEYITCSCGFSAVVNRKLAYQSGLFYEDELDLTGMHEKLVIEPKRSLSSLIDGGKGDPDMLLLDHVPQFIFELLQSQCIVTLCSKCSALCRAVAVYQRRCQDYFNAVEYSDGNEIAYLALEQARLDHSSHPHDYDHLHQHRSFNRQCVMHKWVYMQFEGPACSQDMVRCMKALQPFLQEAIQKKRSTRLWEPVYNVSGPLTWRQFHRMAVRGTEDMAEPLPIPVLLTGHEKDWLSVAPHSIRHWEKLLLEPYSQARNIAYVVVSPDNGFVLNHVKNFFKELSSIYELCRLGKHAPIRRALVDGIMRVNKRSASKVANESIDHWFSMLGDSQVYSKLKTYSQICCHTLAPHLATLNLDKSLFESGSSRPTEHKQAPSPMPPPSCSDGTPNNNSYASPSMSCDNDATQINNVVGSTPAGFGPGSSLVEVDEDDSPPPAIVVYLIDPFTMGEDQPDVHRLINLGLMRCFKTIIDKLPDAMQRHVHVQIISLESILELSHSPDSKAKRIDQLKSLAFSVFTQCRRILMHESTVRSLTGFGPASVFDHFLKPEMEQRSLNPYGVFSPAYILAPVKESKGRHKEAEEALGDPREKSTVLFCTYCLSEDQRWLIATATDELGEILETNCINIEIPNRTRRRKASSRRHGLRKLMDWILGVMSIGVIPWRLVIGRMGRMGHGELKGWWTLLSRKSLAMASKVLKEVCSQCNYLFPSDAPCILSACVVSLEPDSAFRMMPDMFTPDERFGQNSKNCNLSTPQDGTCTHILVFPTSATAQSAQRFQDDSTFNFEEEGDINFIEGEEMEGMGGGMGIGSIFHDIFSEDNAPTQDIDIMDDGLVQQDSLSQPGSPHMGGGMGRTASNYSGQARINGIVMADPLEDCGGSGLQQQPLALGYYVSTASTGVLPQWFWSSCPHLRSSCPTFLKSALHLNQPAVTQAEDYMHSATTKVHPLDSTCTADVLRYVLEGYNSLSWLILDPATQDRRSCLPLHMQALSHLYNLMAALV